MTSKIKKSIIYFTFLAFMLSLIVFIKNDYLLTFIYLVFISIVLFVKPEKLDAFFAVGGLIGMTLGESIFLATGEETFTRTRLLGIMPLWLPFLWSFIFISIKRLFNIWNVRP